MVHIVTNTYSTLPPWFGHAGEMPIELDLGCGKGGFTLELAERYPERLVLGADLMLGRLRRLQRKVERRGLENVELLRAESLELVAFQLPDACVRRVHLLCPDPWPKNRHRAKRLVTSEFLGRVARVLVPDGVLHLSTDHPPYLAALRHIVDGLGIYRHAPDAMADIADLQTDFERQWRSRGKGVPHLCYRLTSSWGRSSFAASR